MESVISRALRYQKYEVGELFSHSLTVGEKKRILCVICLHRNYTKYRLVDSESQLLYMYL